MLPRAGAMWVWVGGGWPIGSGKREGTEGLENMWPGGRHRADALSRGLV